MSGGAPYVRLDPDVRAASYGDALEAVDRHRRLTDEEALAAVLTLRWPGAVYLTGLSRRNWVRADALMGDVLSVRRAATDDVDRRMCIALIDWVLDRV